MQISAQVKISAFVSILCFNSSVFNFFFILKQSVTGESMKGSGVCFLLSASGGP